VKAVSIRQPWAHAIIYLGKNVENRRWATRHRGPLLVHAAKTIDHAAMRSAHLAGWDLSDMQIGGIIGIVTVAGVEHGPERDNPNPWYTGPIGWNLRDPEPRPFYPCRGMPGLFEVSWPPTRLINMHGLKPEQRRGVVPIDRRSPWGNPFRIGEHGTREEVVAAYRAYILNRPDLLARLPGLKGKTLGCWCVPEACHGHVLLDLIRALP